MTDRRATDGRDLVDVVERSLGAGLPALQLRDKDLDGRTLFALAERLRAATRNAGAMLFVNDRIDVAAAVGADGVQLGHASLPVAVARRLLPSGCLVGQSTHALDEVRASIADFVLFGPVFATPSKLAYGAPHGVDVLGNVAAVASVPMIAIGGIDPTNVASVCAAGAHGVAVIRAILGATDPAAATRTLLAALH